MLWVFIFRCGRHGKFFYMRIVVAQFSRSLVHGAYRTQKDFVGSHDSVLADPHYLSIHGHVTSVAAMLGIRYQHTRSTIRRCNER